MFQEINQNRKKYGYARVSSKSQEANSSLESQKEELVGNGIPESNIIIEIGSASNEIKNRPGFQNLIQNVLKESDTLVVTKIDRCARNTLEFLKLQDILFKRKIQFISLDLPYSEDLTINKLISTTLSSIAEFETNRRKERQMQGISSAKKAGKYRGRKTVITKKLIAKVKYLKQNKMLSVSQIVKITGRSRNTIYKVLKEELGYVSNRLVRANQSFSNDVCEAGDGA
jgi:DNA invertase Pin-like site-specific DNA recombinase